MGRSSPKPSKKVFKNKPISVNLPSDLVQKLQEISDAIGEPKSTVMRMAIRLGLRNFSQMEATLQQEMLRDRSAEEKKVTTKSSA